MAEWTTAYINDLPDSAFACINDSGRHYPHHDKSGTLDLPHLRAALSRVGDSDNEQCGKGHLRAHAEEAGMGTTKAEYLKAEHVRGSKWRVLAIPFGGPLKGRDLDGEYFSPRTDIKADWFPQRPTIFHHGADVEMKDELVGLEDPPEKERDGWWAEMWLNRQSAYYDRLDKMLDQGKLYGSSGSMPHLVRKASDGEILVWPHVEQTLTFTPINPFSRITASKAVVDFNSAGIELDPALKGLLAELEDEADLRSDLSGGGVHLPPGGDEAARRVERLTRVFDALRRAI